MTEHEGAARGQTGVYLKCVFCGVGFVTSAADGMEIVSCPSEAGAEARSQMPPRWLTAALKDAVWIGAHGLRPAPPAPSTPESP